MVIRRHPVLSSLAFAGVLAMILPFAQAGRFEDFTKRAAEGPKFKVVAATYYGSDGIEDFVSAVPFADGTIVALGNTWSPEVNPAVKPLILGKGTYKALSAYTDGKKKELRDDNPIMAGTLVFYEPNLKSIRKVVRFDFGIASITAGLATRDGKGILIAGRCTENLRTVAPAVTRIEPADASAKGAGPYKYGDITAPGDVYLARINPDSGKIEWIQIFAGRRTAPDQLWTDKEGNIYGDFRGMVITSADGKTARRLANTPTASGTTRYLGVDPATGLFTFGGDRNTNTGNEPYRQPFMYVYNTKGEKIETLWEPNPKTIASGNKAMNLESDSSPRSMGVLANGDWIISGWSDGGNSVFSRQPKNLNENSPDFGWGMSSWGMKNANSLTHFLRIDPKTYTQIGRATYMSYIPDNFVEARTRGAPNHTSTKRLTVLADGSVAFVGAAATGLIQTPNAFYKYDGSGEKVGGSFVSVMAPGFESMLFASYLPGIDDPNVIPTRRGVLVVGRSRGASGEGEKATKSPAINALQKEKRGDFDAHIILLEPE